MQYLFPLLLSLIVLTLSQKYNYPFCGVDVDNANIKPHTDDLKLVQVIIRHGARTPVGFHCIGLSGPLECQLTHSERPSFNNDNSLYDQTWIRDRNFYEGNCGTGMLTKLGYEQQIRNGKFLKRMYKGFLPDRIDSTTASQYLYIRSTHVQRTFLSAESLLTGLYPPSDRDGTFHININTMDETRESLLVNKNTCPMSDVYHEEFVQSSMWEDEREDVGLPLAIRLGNILNISYEDIDVSEQADCFMSSLCNGYNLDRRIVNDIVQGAVGFSTFYFGEGFRYPDRITAGKTGLGSFINEFTQRMSDTLNKKDNKKFVLYSGHDTTIMPFLVSLNMWDGQWPPYGSIVTSELHDNGTAQTVRFTYNGQVIYLPGCDEYCPFTHFQKLAKDLMPTKQDCELDFKQKKTKTYDIFTMS